MSWAKLDDGFWRNQKVTSVGTVGAGLHAKAISYATDQLTDGRITPTTLRMLAPDIDEPVELAQALVHAGLWEWNGAAWTIHDFAKYNPPAERVKAEREAARERMARVRGGEGRTAGERADSGDGERSGPVQPPHAPSHSRAQTPTPESQSQDRKARVDSAAPDGIEQIGAVLGTTPPKPAPGLSTLQEGLRTGLIELDPVWSKLTFGAVNKLNKRHGRAIVVMAMQRAREEHAVPADVFPWLNAVCDEIKREEVERAGTTTT